MKKDICKPELLAPAGDLEKLKVAVLYGADAVYFGGQNYGLRAKAKNFDLDEIKEGIEFAHAHNVKAYITANIFAHNEDLDGMGEYFKTLESFGVDAFIISDPGVFSIARKFAPSVEIHISTQANNTNSSSAKFWHDLGATRIVLARELSLEEITSIYNNIPETLELESFVHGAMCMSYSGRCVLSNYMNNRDGNRGACSQPCRFKYHLVEETRKGEYFPVYEDERGTYIFNSRDLCMIEHVPELLKAGIKSFKIEGRMKTSFYVATLVKAYRNAIDDFFVDEELYHKNMQKYQDATTSASHRLYTTGFYFGKPDDSAHVYESNSYVRDYDFVGIVWDYDDETGIATVEQRNKFVVGDTVEFISPTGEPMPLVVSHMCNEKGEEILEAPHPKQMIKLKVDFKVQPFDILRKQI